MHRDVVNFLKRVCPRYGLSANYIADSDVYVVHKRGFAIHNFTTKMFYDMPRRARERMFRPLIKRGLAHNLGEKSVRESLVTRTQFGRRIV